MRLELAGGCWLVPEIADGKGNLLCTFKDLLKAKIESQLLPRKLTEEVTGIFGDVDPVIADVFGPGGIVSCLRRGGQGLRRATAKQVESVTEDGKTKEEVKLGILTNTEEKLGAWYTLKGKATNPWAMDNESFPPKQKMGLLYKEFFHDPGAEVPLLQNGLPVA